jgi:hypothetical protein
VVALNTKGAILKLLYFYIEVKTDVRVLLDCLKCQLDNPDAVKQAFRTLAAIFTNVSGGKTKIEDCLFSVDSSLPKTF